jgi:hypothetical protein
MVAGEIYPEKATDRAKQVQLETAFNRAQMRGHSLEQALWDTAHHGQAGYYPQKTFQHGEAFLQSHPDWYKNFQENIWNKALAGSDEARGFTGNASAGVAARQKAKGTPYLDLRQEGGDQYFLERSNRDVMRDLPRLPGDGSAPAQPATAEPGGVPLSEPYQERAGTPIHGKSSTVTLDNGVRFNVAAEHAGQFGGFLNELVAKGAPITEAGGFGTRPHNASAHPGGHAVDVNQQRRNVISKPLAEWWDKNQAAVSEAERRWEMSGGEHWRNPDRGHFSVHRPLNPDEMEAARRSSQESVAGRLNPEPTASGRPQMPLGGPAESTNKAEPVAAGRPSMPLSDETARSPAAARPAAPKQEAAVEKAPEPKTAPKEEPKESGEKRGPR